MRLILSLVLAGALGCDPSPPADLSVADAAGPAVAAEVLLLEVPALEAPPGRGPLDAALVKEQAAARANPKRADLWVLVAQSWVRLARNDSNKELYVNADAAARRALAIDSDHASALNVRGLVLLDQHRFAEAISSAEQVLARDPNDAQALGTLSDAHLELGHFEAAETAAQKMIDFKPDLPSYARAAHLKFLSGDASAAKQLYLSAFDAGRGQRDREPGAWVLVEAAELFRIEADYVGAIAGYDSALARFHDYPPALAGKARALLALGKAGEAKPLAVKALAARADLRTAWLLADICAATRDAPCVTSAEARVREIGELDRLGYADFLATRNVDAAQALALAREEKKQRSNIEVERVLGFALLRAGELEQAQEAMRRANHLGTVHPVLEFQTLAIRLAGGDDAARAELAEFLKRRPAFEPTLAAEAAGLISR